MRGKLKSQLLFKYKNEYQGRYYLYKNWLYKDQNFINLRLLDFGYFNLIKTAKNYKSKLFGSSYCFDYFEKDFSC